MVPEFQLRNVLTAAQRIDLDTALENSSIIYELDSAVLRQRAYPSGVLIGAFSWDSSPQRGDFWRCLHSSLMRNGS